MLDIFMIGLAIVLLIFIYLGIKRKKKDIKKNEKETGRDYHEGEAKDTKFR